MSLDAFCFTTKIVAHENHLAKAHLNATRFLLIASSSLSRALVWCLVRAHEPGLSKWVDTIFNIFLHHFVINSH